MSYDLTAEMNYKLKQLDESCRMMIKAGTDKANRVLENQIAREWTTNRGGI